MQEKTKEKTHQTHYSETNDELYRQAPELRVVGADGRVHDISGVHETKLLQIVQNIGRK